MANTTQARLLEEFGELFNGKTTGQSDTVTQSLADTVAQLGQISAGMAPQASAAATPAGTNTPGGVSTTNSNSGGVSAGSIATTFLEGGFGIVPLITGLLGLFGGGSDTPPALEKYVIPSAISFESADTGGGLTASDFDQTGAPRSYSPVVDASNGPTGSGAGSQGGTPAASAGTSQITVNVQAMDAQSFMDYSTQIAQAVRGAMLNLSSLNDVVNEL